MVYFSIPVEIDKDLSSPCVVIIAECEDVNTNPFSQTAWHITDEWFFYTGLLILLTNYATFNFGLYLYKYTKPL